MDNHENTIENIFEIEFEEFSFESPKKNIIISDFNKDINPPESTKPTSALIKLLKNQKEKKVNILNQDQKESEINKETLEYQEQIDNYFSSEKKIDSNQKEVMEIQEMNQENNSNVNVENINANGTINNFLINNNEIRNMPNQSENEILQYNLINPEAIIFPNNILGDQNFFTDNSAQDLENCVEVLNGNFNNYIGNEKDMIIDEDVYDVYEFRNKNDNLEYFYFVGIIQASIKSSINEILLNI